MKIEDYSPDIHLEMAKGFQEIGKALEKFRKDEIDEINCINNISEI